MEGKALKHASFIIEGSDNLGKSTLALKLAGNCGMRVQHMSKPPEDARYPGFYLEKLEEGVVYDRFHLGGLAYGRIGGLHEWEVDNVTFRGIIQSIRSRKIATIVLYAGDDSWYRDRLMASERAEMFDVESILQVNRIYRNMAGTADFMGTKLCDMAFDVCNGYVEAEDVIR